MNLRVPGFVMGAKERTEGGLNLNFDKGGHLNANAHYDADGGNLDAKVDLTGFALRNVEGYIKDIIDFDEVAGTLAAHVSLKGRTAELLKSHIAATMTLSDVDLQAGKAQVAGLKELNVKVNNINLDEYAQYFNDSKLWKKLKKVARKAGRKAVYYVLVLYYVSRDPAVPRSMKLKVLG